MKNALLITVVMLISLCGNAQTKHQLTIETGETLAEVAYQTGFSEPSNFSRTFKKHFGCSPTKYVKNK